MPVEVAHPNAGEEETLSDEDRADAGVAGGEEAMGGASSGTGGDDAGERANDVPGGPQSFRSGEHGLPEGLVGFENILSDVFLRMLLNTDLSEQLSEEDVAAERAEKHRQRKEMIADQANARLLFTAKGPSAFTGLRVSQLKSILRQNFVDHSKCKLVASDTLHRELHSLNSHL